MTEHDPSSLTVFLCGDVMLARGIDQILAAPCEPRLFEPYIQDARDYITLAEQASGEIPRSVAPEYPWGDALELLDRERPDARIINLETSITRSDLHDLEKDIHYRISPENAATLAAARIDACVLANNHVLDWGVPGLLDTLGALDRLEIAHCGAGRNLVEAFHPAVIDRGERGRIAVFSIGCIDAGVPRWWSAGLERPGVVVFRKLGDDAIREVRQEIEPWRARGMIIVLSIHWGPNWGFEVPAEHRRFAHRLIDEAGVHIVHGHSSHHVKGIEVHEGHPIFYGCGDLLTDYEGIRGHQEFRGDLSLLYLVTLDRSGALVKLDMLPTQMRKLQIRRADAAGTRWLAEVLDRTGSALGSLVVRGEHRLTLAW